jgi:serine/threonine protein kinase
MSSDGSQADFSRSRLPPGTRLNGIYEIDHPIGLGGMGEIYKGHLVETGDPVAIKMMLPELSANDAAFTLFRKEASALHHIQHDAVVRYYVFTVEPVLRRPYLAMEFVDGRTLTEILDEGPLSFEAVRSLLQRLASGLQAAHEHGIIHRDISPDNIILPNNNVTRAKIIDFGIARTNQHGTVIGSGFAGKFSYVSPEQLGLYGGDVTAKSDIYSLGLVLAQALTAKPLDMGGSQVEIIEKRRKVPALGAIDMKFRPLLERMLQPDPAQRPDSMAAVAAWSFGSAPIGREGRSDSAERSGPRHTGGRWRLVAAGLLLIALICGGGGAYYFYAMQTPISKTTPLPANLTKSEAEPAKSPPALLTPDSPANLGKPTAEPEPQKIPPALLAPAASTNLAKSEAEPQKNSPAGLAPPVPANLAKSDAEPQKNSPAALAPPVVVSATEKIKNYVEQYDGGNCFFVAPVALGEHAAAIEGFGASVEPFRSFDTAFHRAMGFEADIGIRQVTEQQCPAVGFLARVRGAAARAPRLDIEQEDLHNGSVLNGIVDRYGERQVALILVSDAGTVQNVSNLLKPGTDAKTFNIGMKRPEGVTGRQPQLLIAVASAPPINALQTSEPAKADQFFGRVLSEAANSGAQLSAAARYFVLEK